MFYLLRILHHLGLLHVLLVLGKEISDDRMDFLVMFYLLFPVDDLLLHCAEALELQHAPLVDSLHFRQGQGSAEGARQHFALRNGDLIFLRASGTAEHFALRNGDLKDGKIRPFEAHGG